MRIREPCVSKFCALLLYRIILCHHSLDKKRLAVLLGIFVSLTVIVNSFSYEQHLPTSLVAGAVLSNTTLSEENPPKMITWTILDYYPKTNYISVEEQEQILKKAFNNWIQHINAEAVFIPHANAKDVFCTVQFTPPTNVNAISAGRGDGKSWCKIFFNSNKIFYIDSPPPNMVAYKLESHATHVIGHGLGLSDMQCQGCIMNPSIGTSVVPQPVEITKLQTIWGIKQPPPIEEPSPPKEPTLVVVLRSSYPDQQRLVDMYKPYLKSSDYVVTFLGARNLDSAEKLPGSKVAAFASVSDVKDAINSLKGRVDYIGYDIERAGSPQSDLADPVLAVKTASEALHNNGMKLILAPSGKLTDIYGEQFAPYVDVYNLQYQAYQKDPSLYKTKVISMTEKLRKANPSIVVITQVSTLRGSVENMQETFSSVKDKVDGVTMFYGLTEGNFTAITEFLEFTKQFRQ